MKKNLLLIITLCIVSSSYAQDTFKKEEILKNLMLANAYFMDKWPDTGKTIITNKERPSNIWTRGVYYEGLMALHEIYPKESYYQYALDWANSHKWGFNGGNTTRNADNYCAAQTYIDLYNLEPEASKLKNTRSCMQMLN
ncbi:MAG: glycoside hydrolase family 88 protein [Galbibacter orientalis]|uniref:glycoside hydrolase family 88 protein n=1 Tax=Galbibacter orientalis TaxID=453852 RepID=UPI00300312DF